MPETWTETLNEKGSEETMRLLINAIEADTFLLRAVEVTNIEWCIQRLKEVKKKKGNVKKIAEIAFGADAEIVSGQTKNYNAI